MHQEDFSVDCEWNFFATSYGKSPCDGIGGTLKRLATGASLQRPLSDQILTAHHLYQFCDQEVTGINVFFVSTQELSEIRFKLRKRSESAATLPETRGFHHFAPVSSTVIAAKRVSEDTELDLKYDLVLGNKSIAITEVKLSDFVACLYDGKC